MITQLCHFCMYMKITTRSSVTLLFVLNTVLKCFTMSFNLEQETYIHFTAHTGKPYSWHNQTTGFLEVVDGQKHSINGRVIPVSMGIWHRNKYIMCIRQQTSQGAEENFWDVKMQKKIDQKGKAANCKIEKKCLGLLISYKEQLSC